MKAKIIFDGKEIEINVTENFLLELKSWISGEKKKTGYERVKPFETYFLQTYNGKATDGIEDGDIFDDSLYATANYYSDRTVAENNARADKLYRQLRRFAVEHRDEKIDWDYKLQWKYSIYFCHSEKKLDIDDARDFQEFGQIYFDSEKTAQLAIDTFKDELIWYFTEYKDSL